jgi:small subunit ribosomal protein S10
MSREKIRLSLHSFNYKILDEACKKILSVAEITENPENIKGPIPLPTRKRIYCVLRSPHVDKDSREQFEIRRYKRIIDIYPESAQTFDAFLKIELPPGVSIDVQIYSKEPNLN